MTSSRFDLGSTSKTLNLALLRFNERSGSENLTSERVSPDMTGGMVASHIQCIPPNLLAAFMWRRLLNNATLAAATHKGFGKVSNGTSTRVVD